MSKSKLLLKITDSPKNTSFNEFKSLIEGFGFSLDSTKGNH